MARVRFSKGKQRKFLEKVKLRLGDNWDGVAKVCKVTPRTVRDWAREKYNISHDAVKQLSNAIKHSIPKSIRILPEHWSTKKASRMGGLRYAELYGSPGTVESRRKGGIISQKKLSANPELAKKLGFAIRKTIKTPSNSPALAEFIGIMLGDGGVRNDYQITISYNSKEDKDYAGYIRRMIKNLFGVSSSDHIGKTGVDIVVTGKNLVEYLQKKGIKKGNKVRNQIDVPRWLFENKEYQTACLRGLFDTDGCVYQHKYMVAGKKYRYAKMCFSNHSVPILKSVRNMLENLGFHAVLDKRQEAVYLHSPSGVMRYFLKVGTSNPRYRNRYNEFFSVKMGRQE